VGVLVLLVNDLERRPIDLALVRHAVELVSPDGAGVGLAVADGVDDVVLDVAGELNDEVAARRQPAGEQLAPLHPPPAEGLLGGRDQHLVAQVGQPVDVGPVGAGEDDPGEVRKDDALVLGLERGDAGDAEACLEVHVIRGAGGDEIHGAALDGAVDHGEPERHDLKPPPGSAGEVVGGRLPGGAGVVVAAVREHPQPDGAVQGPRIGLSGRPCRGRGGESLGPGNRQQRRHRHEEQHGARGPGGAGGGRVPEYAWRSHDSAPWSAGVLRCLTWSSRLAEQFSRAFTPSAPRRLRRWPRAPAAPSAE
jgi:hypothetical protein